MALDIDNYPVARAWLENRGVDLDALLAADDAVQIVSGRVDSAKLLYAVSPRPGVACAEYPGFDKNGKPVKKLSLDFRCATAGGNSQQDVLPESIHPGRGQPYEWRFGLMGDWRILPPLPTALEAIWDELRAPTTVAPPTVAVPSGAAPAKIQAWLDTQDPGMCRTDWVVVGMKLHAEFRGSAEGFEIWQRWSSKSPKWDDEARQTMYPIWKGFRLEGRQLATLAADVRTMPADVTEFPVVPKEFASPAPSSLADSTPGDLINAEGAGERELRELMQNWVVLQTGGGEPYFLLPGHPVKEIRESAGLAGVEIGRDQLGDIFGPYLPMIPKGRTIAKPDPSEVMRNARWRRRVHRMAFRPGGQENYVSDDGHTYLNAYKPIPVTVIKPTESQIAPLDWLLRRVLDDDDNPSGGQFSTWLIRLYAFCLQNPGIKVKWAPLLYSAEQGTGKTTLMETLPSLLYGRQYVKPMVHTVLRERFAGARFDSTWWVCITEMHADTGKVDSKAIANKLKPWITDDTIPIEKKGVDAFEIKNYLQLTAASNHEDCLYMEEGTNDRRWLVGEMLGVALTTQEKAALNPLFGDDHVRDPRAQGWLHWYFKHNVDLTGFNPAESPPNTKAKVRVREQGRSAWEDAVFTAIDNQIPPFDKDVVQPLDITQNLLVGKGVTLGQARNLLMRAGALPLRKMDFSRSLYSVRNHHKWKRAKPAAIQKHMLDGLTPVDDADDLL